MLRSRCLNGKTAIFWSILGSTKTEWYASRYLFSSTEIILLVTSFLLAHTMCALAYMGAQICWECKLTYEEQIEEDSKIERVNAIVLGQTLGN